MVPVKVKKLHPDAVVPKYATDGAAGFDLVAAEEVIIHPGETAKVGLGLSFEIPEGYVMYVCMRSGIGLKTKLRQSNGIGIIDSDYRGEVAMMFDNTCENEVHDGVHGLVNGNYLMEFDGRIEEIDGRVMEANVPYLIRKGDRIAQGVLAKVPIAQFEVVDELDETERGQGGFGSTGTN